MQLQIEFYYQASIDLIVLAIVAILTTVILSSAQSTIVRLILGSPMVFLYTGYAFIEVLFIGNQFPTYYRLLLVLGSSLSIDILTGLVLHWLAIPLETLSWGLALSVFIVVVSSIALVLRVLQGRNPVRRLRIRFHIAALVVPVLASIVGVQALILASNAVTHQPEGRFTQLSVDSYESRDKQLRVAIHSEEASQTKYRLEIRTDGIEIKEYQFVLEPKQDQFFTISAGDAEVTGSDIVIDLYREDNPTTIYRHVRWNASLVGGK